MVVNCHTIKPLDDHLLLEVIKECGAVVTVEEHQVKGGLGGAVAELVAREHPVPIEFIGMQDTFGETGAPEELIEKYGMGSKSIKEAIKKVVKRK
jgi:transketolase